MHARLSRTHLASEQQPQQEAEGSGRGKVAVLCYDTYEWHELASIMYTLHPNYMRCTHLASEQQPQQALWEGLPACLCLRERHLRSGCRGAAMHAAA